MNRLLEINSLLGDIEVLEKTLQKAEKALGKYGTHRTDCIAHPLSDNEFAEKCDCGLGDALSKIKEMRGCGNQ